MNKLRGKKEKVLILLVLIFVGIVSAAFNFSNPGSIKSTTKLEKLEQKFGKEAIYVYLQVLSFDEIHQSAKIRMYLYPPNTIANSFSSSVQTYYKVKLTLDAAQIDSKEELVWNSGDFIRAIDFQLDATNEAFSNRASDAYYPFDNYSVRTFAAIEIQIKGEETKTTEDDEWVGLPIVVKPYTSVLPGWSINYDMYSTSKETSKLFQNGELAIELKLFRPSLYKYITLLIGLLFLFSASALLAYAARVVAKKKKPEIEGLVWSASTIFTLIQARNVLPNGPRIGVKFDLIIFYPSIAITLLSSGLIFYGWLLEKSESNQLH